MDLNNIHYFLLQTIVKFTHKFNFFLKFHYVEV